MRDILTGAKSYWLAWRLAWKERMWPLLIGPGLIAALYFPVVIVLTFRYGGMLADYGREKWLPEFLKQRFFFFLIVISVWALGLYAGFVLFRNVVMMLYSPVLGFLSRKTEEKLRPPGSQNAANDSGMWRGALRGFAMSLTSLGLAIGLFFVCLATLIVPVLGELSLAVLLPMSQMFLAGHGFMDPTLERRNVGVVQSFKFAWRHRWRAVGCGAVFVILAMIPVVGWFLAPTLGVVAGTILALETLEMNQPPRLARMEGELTPVG